jgi:hypothetical protein
LDFKKWNVRILTEFVWLRMGSSGGLIWKLWTNCAFGLYPSSGVSKNKIEELKI